MQKTLRYIFEDWKQYLSEFNKNQWLYFFPVFFINPGMFFSLIFRVNNYFITNPFIFFRLFGWILYPFHYLISYYLLDIDIKPQTKIGKGLFLHNRGIVVTSQSELGDYVSLFGPVTLGTNFDNNGPIIGNNVKIAVGARILGKVHIGDNTIIGANAVVISDIPSNSMAAGIPAQVKRSKTI